MSLFNKIIPCKRICSFIIPRYCDFGAKIVMDYILIDLIVFMPFISKRVELWAYTKPIEIIGL